MPDVAFSSVIRVVRSDNSSSVSLDTVDCMEFVTQKTQKTNQTTFILHAVYYEYSTVPIHSNRSLYLV